MEPNTIKATALNVGRELEKEEWFNMSPVEAESFCQKKLEERGIDKRYHEIITMLAMSFVLTITEEKRI